MKSSSRTPRRKRPLISADHLIPALLVGSILLHGAGGYLFYRWEDLRYSVMRYDPDAVDELTEEAKKREAERKKREEEKRERTEIKQEDAEQLMAEEERRKKKEILQQIEEMRQLQEELEELVDEKKVEAGLNDQQANADFDREAALLSTRELFTLLKEKTEHLNADNMEMDQLIGALSDRGDHRRRDPVEKMTSSRKAVEAESQELIIQFAERLRESNLRITALAALLPALGQMQEDGWNLAQGASSLFGRSRRNQAASDKRVEDLRKNIASLETGGKVVGEFAGSKPEALQNEMRRINEFIDRNQPKVQKDQVASLHAHSIARQAMEINQLALKYLADHLLENIDELSAEEMYRLAKLLEEALARSFAELRARELALVQDISFEEALSDVTVPSYNRPDLANELNPENVKTIGDLRQFRQGLQTALNQSEAMKLNAQNLVNQARGLNAMEEQGSSINMTAMRRAMMESAQHGASMRGQVMDMSGIMRATSGNSSSNPFGGGGDGSGPMGGPANLRAKLSWNESRLNERQIVAQALPGRKFTKDSKRTGWLYLDTWYIIGPWQADGGIDYTIKHEPETVIDLDAEYLGKPDPSTGAPQILKWQFFQSSSVKLRPPNEQTGATYYAYTEVYFEEGADILVAIGSDDGAKVWINDLVVWQDDELSGWSLEEGYRKVFFQKGYNKILVRLGNGPNTCTFSVLLCPPEAMGL